MPLFLVFLSLWAILFKTGKWKNLNGACCSITLLRCQSDIWSTSNSHFQSYIHWSNIFLISHVVDVIYDLPESLQRQVPIKFPILHFRNWNLTFHVIHFHILDATSKMQSFDQWKHFVFWGGELAFGHFRKQFSFGNFYFSAIKRIWNFRDELSYYRINFIELSDDPSLGLAMVIFLLCIIVPWIYVEEVSKWEPEEFIIVVLRTSVDELFKIFIL